MAKQAAPCKLAADERRDQPGGTDSGRGGAISNAGTFSVTNSTITNNSANVGGGLANSGTFSGGVFTPAPFDLGNSIVANNSAALGPDLVDTFNSIDYNFVRSISFVTFTGATAHNIYGQDPFLGALQDNGVRRGDVPGDHPGQEALGLRAVRRDADATRPAG